MSVASKFRVLALAAAVGAMSVPVVAHAQNNGGGNNGGGNGGGGGGGGGRGGWNPQQMRQRMMDNLKEQLGTSDDEFTAIQPKVEKVVTAQQAASTGVNYRALMGRGGRGGGGAGGGGNGGGGNGGGGGGGGAGGNGGGGRRGGGGPGGFGGDPNSPVAKATTDLQATLDDKEAKPEDIKAKLDALRAAKAAAKTDLSKAQDDLKGVLTARQEAVMVEDGLLD